MTILVQLLAALATLLFVYCVHSILSVEAACPHFPVVALQERGLSAKKSWIKAAEDVIKKGLEQHHGRPFQVISGTGPKIVLPNHFADEVKAGAHLNFMAANFREFFIDYPGINALRSAPEDEGLVAEVVRTKLTQSLGLITRDLVEEATLAVYDIFGEDIEWREVNMKQKTLHLIARLSSRIFLGSGLCRNERWLEISKGLTVQVFITAQLLRVLPGIVRPILAPFLPSMISLRRMIRDAKRLIAPEVERRTQAARNARGTEAKVPKSADAISWMYEVAGDRRDQVDYVAAQLQLTLAAINTSTEALMAALIDLCQNRELLKSLRREVIDVVGSDGWSSQALYKFRVMDSFLKESQRMHPPNLVSMRRVVEKSMTLSDGSVLPEGSQFFVVANYQDPSIYTDPETADPYRFSREREKPGQANSWQHVTVSPSHFGFGYGQHACPGRFFASNELKIALARILLRYDLELVDDSKDMFWTFESITMSKSNCKFRVRKREAEIDIESVSR